MPNGHPQQAPQRPPPQQGGGGSRPSQAPPPQGTLSPAPTTPQPAQQIQSGDLVLIGGDQYMVTVFATGPISTVPAEANIQSTLGSNYAVANVEHNVPNTVSFLLGVVNTITVKSDTIAAAVGAPAGSVVALSSPTPVTPAPSSPSGQSTGASNAASTGLVTTGLIVTAVVITAVGWFVDRALTGAFTKKNNKKKK
jgi:hypothetical protein